MFVRMPPKKHITVTVHGTIQCFLLTVHLEVFLQVNSLIIVALGWRREFYPHFIANLSTLGLSVSNVFFVQGETKTDCSQITYLFITVYNRFIQSFILTNCANHVIPFRQQVSLFAPEEGQVIDKLFANKNTNNITTYIATITTTSTIYPITPLSTQVKSELCHTGQRFLKIREVDQLFITSNTLNLTLNLTSVATALKNSSDQNRCNIKSTNIAGVCPLVGNEGGGEWFLWGRLTLSLLSRRRWESE